MEEKMNEREEALKETIKIWKEVTISEDPSKKPSWAYNKYLFGCPLCSFTEQVCIYCPIDWPVTIGPKSTTPPCHSSYYEEWRKAENNFDRRVAAITIVGLAEEALAKLGKKEESSLIVRINDKKHSTESIGLRISTPNGGQVNIDGDAHLLDIYFDKEGNIKTCRHPWISTRIAEMVGMVLGKNCEMDLDSVHTRYNEKSYKCTEPIPGVENFEYFLEFAEKQGWIEQLITSGHLSKVEKVETALEIKIDKKDKYYLTDGIMYILYKEYYILEIRMEEGKIAKVYRPTSVSSKLGFKLDELSRVIF